MTRRSSLRAAARENYVAMTKGQGANAHPEENAPTPDPSSLRFGGQAPSPRVASARGGGEQTDLTTRVRELYETSAVPVREIAQLVGVTERTIYKYVIKQNWKRRYAGRGAEAGRANRGRRWQRAAGHEPVKGAGGRFIARADANKPVATGLKATDPQGRARAEVACATAARLSDEAQVKALAHRRTEQRIIWLDTLGKMVSEYNAFRRQRAERRQSPRKKEPPKVGKYDRIIGSAYSKYSASPEPSKEPARKARAARAALSPLESKLEALYVRLVETALAHVQALQD